MKVITVLLVALATACGVESTVESLDSEVDFPYLVSCKFQTLLHGQTLCGGVIISPIWVLTAASCMKNALLVTIFAGSNSFLEGILRTVSALSFKRNDEIGLVNVPPLNLGLLIASINLPPVDFSNPLDNTLAVSVGWGQTVKPGNGSALAFLNVRTITNTECSRYRKVQPSEVCASYTVAGNGCNILPGGALIANNTMIGAVSWRLTCPQITPELYARISSHRTWLIGVTGI